MATEYEKQLVSQYGSGIQDLINAERAKGGKNNLLRGSNVDKQDVARIESAFKASDVFKSQNINQTINYPAQLDLGDLVGVRARLEDELGYTDAQDELLRAKEALSQFDIASGQQQADIGQRLVPMEVLRGEQATAAQQRAIDRQSLVSEFQAKSDLMSALGSQLETRFGIYQQQRGELADLMVQAPGAGITFTDSLESAVGKLKKYQEKTRKEQEEADKKRIEDARKEELRNLALQYGVSWKTDKGGTRNADQLAEAIAKKAKGDREAEERLRAIEEQSAKLQLQKVSMSISGGGVDKKRLLKTELLDSIYSGTRNREQAKALYEMQTGENWNIYEDIPDGYQVMKEYADTYDPITGKKVLYDENGRPYIEE